MQDISIVRTEYDDLKDGRKYHVSLETPVGSIEFSGVLMSSDGYSYHLTSIGDVTVNTNGLHGVVFSHVKLKDNFS